MDQRLQSLIRQLQDQKCPPAVLDRVGQRIAREKATRRAWRPSPALSLAVSVALLLGAFALWQWQARREAQMVAAEFAIAQAQAERALVVQQAQEAFGYIGQALLRAALYTENALQKEAVPPLRNSFETIKNKVSKPI